MKKSDLYVKILFFVTLALIAWVRLRHAGAPMERDEGEYAVAAWRILRGSVPYVDFYNMKLPGVYAAYALIFKLLGESVWAIRAALWLVNAASIGFVWMAARRLFSANAAYVSAAAFGLMSVGFFAQGMIANCEHFVVFFVTAGLVFLLKNGLWRDYFAAGLLIGTAILMKQHAAAFAVWGLLYALFQRQFWGAAAVLLGSVLPLSMLTWWMVQAGHFDAFKFWVFDYAKAYSGQMAPTLKYISNFKYIFADNPAFWLLTFSALYVAALRLRTDKNALGLGILFLSSFAAVCPGWFFREHYFQLLFPAAALLVGFAFDHVKFEKIRLDALKVVILSVVLSLATQFRYFFVNTPSETIGRLYPKEFFVETAQIGAFLREKSAKNDVIGQYGSEPQLWFYANRRAASGFLYAYPLVENQPFAEKMTAQFIAETERSTPRWFVYSNVSKGKTNATTFEKLENWSADFSKKYRPLGVLYKIDETKADWQPEATAIDSTREVLMVIFFKYDDTTQ